MNKKLGTKFKKGKSEDDYQKMEWKMNIFTFLNTEHVSGSELGIVIASCIFF